MYLVLQLGADTAVACSHVQLLGVDISSDLSLDHSSRLPLRVPARAAITDSTDFVNSVVSGGRWLHSSTLLRRCELSDRLLQHCSCCTCTKDSYGQATALLNGAACIVTGTRKFDRGLLGQILRDELHWLDVSDRVSSSWQ